MKTKILIGSLIAIMLVSHFLPSCYQELPQLYGNDFKWCGYKIQAWGTSITDAPGYLNGQGIYGVWYLANKIKVDSIINRTDPGYGNRNLLLYNNAHSWGYPGATAPYIADQWFKIGDNGKQQGDPTQSQVWEFSRNSESDTASIRASIMRVYSALQPYHNNRWLIVLASKANSPSEDTSTAKGKMINKFNLDLIKDFGVTHCISLASYFHQYQTTYELINEFIPKQFTLGYDPNVPGSGDGLHPNQPGVKIAWEGMAGSLEQCTGIITALNLKTINY